MSAQPLSYTQQFALEWLATQVDPVRGSQWRRADIQNKTMYSLERRGLAGWSDTHHTYAINDEGRAALAKATGVRT